MRRDLRYCVLYCDVGFCFYEKSLDTVKRAIDSVKDHVRYIYAIDGKFKLYESKDELSAPDVRQYLSTVPNVRLVDAPNLLENQKRQIYLDLAKRDESNYLLILDADCFITKDTDWNKFYEVLSGLGKGEKPKIFCIAVQTTHKISWFPLLWYKPYLLKYLNTHNFWEDTTDGSIYKSTNNGTRAAHIYLKSNDKLRTEDYLIKSRDYQSKLMAYEKPYKELYRKVAKNVSQPKDYNSMFNGVPMM